MDDLERGAALRELAEHERARGNAEGARAAYIEAVEILRRCDDRLKFAHTIRHLGDVYREQGDARSAAACYDEALAVYRTHPARRVLDFANAVRGLAVLRGNDAQLWAEARDLYAEAGVEQGVAECTRRLAALT